MFFNKLQGLLNQNPEVSKTVLKKHFKGFELDLALFIIGEKEDKEIILEYENLPENFHQYWSDETEELMLEFLLSNGSEEQLEEALLIESLSDDIKEEIVANLFADEESIQTFLNKHNFKNLPGYLLIYKDKFKLSLPLSSSHEDSWGLILNQLKQNKESIHQIDIKFLEIEKIIQIANILGLDKTIDFLSEEKIVELFKALKDNEDKKIIMSKLKSSNFSSIIAHIDAPLAFEYFKSHGNSLEYDLQEKIIEISLKQNNSEYALYYLLTDQMPTLLKNKIISLAIKEDFFELRSVSAYAYADVVEYLVDNNKIQVELKEEKTISYKGEEIISLGEDFVYNNILDKTEVLKKLKKILQEPAPEYPDLIKGFYNIFEEKFYALDDLDTKYLKFKIQEIDSLEYKEAFYFKPDYKIPALAKKDKQFTYNLSLDFSFLKNKPLNYSSDMKKMLADIKERIAILKNNLKDDNLPKSERAFGIELELCIGKLRPSDLALDMESNSDYADLNPEEMGDAKFPTNEWVVKPDRSIKYLDKKGKPLTDEKIKQLQLFTAEITSPKLSGMSGLEEISDKLKILQGENSDQFSVNNSCGFHIHHDVSDLIKAIDEKTTNDDYQDEIKKELKSKMYFEFYKIQDLVYEICGSSRQNNPFCYKLKIENNLSDDAKDIFAQQEIPSNYRPGFNALTPHGTIEFRMFQGTLNLEEIQEKVLLTHQIVEAVAKKIKGLKLEAQEILKNAIIQLELVKIEEWEQKILKQENISQEDFERFYNHWSKSMWLFSR